MTATALKNPSMRSAAGVTSNEAKLPWIVIIFLVVTLLPISISAGGLLLTPLRLFLLVVIVPLAVNLVSGKYGRLLITDIFFVLHIIWMAVCLQVNNPNQLVEFVGSTAIEFMGGYLIARAHIQSRERFLALCKLLGLIVVILLPITVIESVAGQNLVVDILRKLPGIRVNPYGYNEPRLGLERAQVVLAHPIHWGIFCSTAFALTVVSLRGVLSPARLFFSGVIIAFSTFLSLSSGAFLSLVIQIVLLMWTAIFRRSDWRWWTLVGLSVAAYVVVDLLSNRTPIQVFFTYATFSPHTAYWRSIIFEWGMINVWNNPIFGLGLNDWERPWFMFSGSMDNFFLLLAVRYGIPGFFLFAVGYIHLIYQTMFKNLNGDEEMMRIRLGWILLLVGMTFSLTTVHVWNAIYAFVFFIFGAGAWIHMVPPRDSSSVVVAEQADGGRRKGMYTRHAPWKKIVPSANEDAASRRSGQSGRETKYTRFRTNT